VSTKERINHALSRVTGHHLTKGAPGEERARSQQELARARSQLRTTREALAKYQAAEKSAAEARKRRPEFPDDFDEEMREIIRAVRGWTMTNNDKLFALITAVRYLIRHNVPGDMVECGVWRGGSMQAVARQLLKLDVTDRDLYLFDTFEGMPPPTDVDVRWDGKSAAQLLESQERTKLIWAEASLEDVKSGFEALPYPSERIHYIQGKVEDTVPDNVPERIALLRLDTDWYESSLHELEHMYDRLVPGGVLILDDYGYWQGQKVATDEWLERHNPQLLLNRMSQGRIAVKPAQ
jgi:O-methyltransferase